ncbi:MAG TPA: hypothetical protein VJ302_23230 [Blastocatellia bacterium]|nr:hypothetical protein [Blastocatellia bacterium]
MYFKQGLVVRLAALIYQIQRYFKDETPADRQELLAELQELSEVCRDLSEDCSLVRSFIADMIEVLTHPQDAPLTERKNWSEEVLSERVRMLPSTLEFDTKKYYQWLGRQLKGRGEIVELGVWLGAATNCLAEGLRENPAFNGRHIHAYDLYTWQAWMYKYLEENLIKDLPELRSLKGGDDFLGIYRKICEPVRNYIKPVKCSILPDNGYRHLPAASWKGEPIELLLYDLAHEYPYIDEVWRVFSPSFIRGQTILVFNVYGNTRAEGLRRFIHQQRSLLRPLHKPRSGAKSYLYLG